MTRISGRLVWLERRGPGAPCFPLRLKPRESPFKGHELVRALCFEWMLELKEVPVPKSYCDHVEVVRKVKVLASLVAPIERDRLGSTGGNTDPALNRVVRLLGPVGYGVGDHRGFAKDRFNVQLYRWPSAYVGERDSEDSSFVPNHRVTSKTHDDRGAKAVPSCLSELTELLLMVRRGVGDLPLDPCVGEVGEYGEQQARESTDPCTGGNPPVSGRGIGREPNHDFDHTRIVGAL